MTDRKPNGPYLASSRLAFHSDCWAVYRPGHGCLAEFYYYRIDRMFPTFEDARRHAEDFAAKLNAEHASALERERHMDCYQYGTVDAAGKDAK